MRALLGILVAFLALCGAAWAQNLSPRAFTEEFAREFRRALPAATVTAGDLQLTVRRPNGQTTVNLANSYATYSLQPHRLRELISTQLALVVPFNNAPAAAAAKVDPSKIVPVIKDRAWLRDTQEQIKKTGAKEEPLFEDLNDELLIAYAEDSAKAMRYLWASEYSGNRSRLRALAVENLMGVLPQVEMRYVNPQVAWLSAGDDYTASLLLVEHLWTSGQIKVPGDIVVAVPARDIILATGSRSSMLKNVRSMAERTFKDGPYSLTDALFVYRNKRFTKFVGD